MRAIVILRALRRLARLLTRSLGGLLSLPPGLLRRLLRLRAPSFRLAAPRPRVALEDRVWDCLRGNDRHSNAQARQEPNPTTPRRIRSQALRTVFERSLLTITGRPLGERRHNVVEVSDYSDLVAKIGIVLCAVRYAPKQTVDGGPTAGRGAARRRGQIAEDPGIF